MPYLPVFQNLASTPNQIPMKKQAIIVGAGLAGSLWAALLAKRGYSVDVYELRDDPRRAGFAGGRSINLGMSSRG